MTHKPIVMIAKFQVPQNTEDVFRQAFLELIAPSQAEKDCLTYELFQVEDDPTSFLLYERWKDQVALDYHFSTSYFQNFKAQFPDIFAETLSSGLTRLVKLQRTL